MYIKIWFAQHVQCNLYITIKQQKLKQNSINWDQFQEIYFSIPTRTQIVAFGSLGSWRKTEKT